MKKLIFPTLFAITLLTVIVGCPPAPVPPHPTPVVTDTFLCPDADTHMAALCQADPVKNAYCCQVDALTKKGKNYTQFCIEKQNQGIFLNPRCVSQVTSCEQIDVCTQSQ